jgi:hypothetical protein
LTHQGKTFVDGAREIGFGYLKFTYSLEENGIIHGNICDVGSYKIAKMTTFIRFANHQQFEIDAFICPGVSGIRVLAGKENDREERREKNEE